MTRARFGAALVIAVVVGGCATACTAQQSADPGRGAETPPAVVQVEKRSLTSTVVLSGTIVPNPEFLVEAPTAGQVAYTDRSAAGSSVDAEQVIARVDGQPVVAPAPGTIAEMRAADATDVVPRIPIAVVAYRGFGVLVDVPVSEQYRLYEGAVTATVNVTGGPSGIDCRLVPSAGTPDAKEGVGVLCLLPLDAAVASGLETKVGLNTGSRADVLTLPLQAVSGRAGQGRVSRVNPDGSRETVTVGLGLTDGVSIEIVSGLEAGDTVAGLPPGVG